tara:strand:+ start:336 stop:938 length:603 start_codon:yes stop_codon:yes gene_type:complete
MDRKKKLRFIQISLLVLGTIIILFTYSNKRNNSELRILTQETQKKVQEQLVNQNEKEDIFYNIEYSGLDLSGNRYILKSKEAFNDKSNQEVVNMKLVEAYFYFKDETILKIFSKKGVYNNRTLDMTFYDEINAFYDGSELTAQKAEYSNSGGYLVISGKVQLNDIKGTIAADKLFFDIKKQTLDIASFDDNKINANINLK